MPKVASMERYTGVPRGMEPAGVAERCSCKLAGCASSSREEWRRNGKTDEDIRV